MTLGMATVLDSSLRVRLTDSAPPGDVKQDSYASAPSSAISSSTTFMSTSYGNNTQSSPSPPPVHTSTSSPITQTTYNPSSTPPVSHPTGMSGQSAVRHDLESAESTNTATDNHTLSDSASKSPLTSVSSPPSGSSTTGTSNTSPTAVLGNNATSLSSTATPTTTESATIASSASQVTVGSSPRDILPVILGSVLGGVALLLLLLFLFFFLRRRGYRRRNLASLKWETVNDYNDDEPPLSPMSSDSGHGLIMHQQMPINLDSQVQLQWVNANLERQRLDTEQAELRGISPSAASTISSASTVMFAPPATSTNAQGVRHSVVTPTGHYTPSEENHRVNPFFHENLVEQSQKKRPSLMTVIHGNG